MRQLPLFAAAFGGTLVVLLIAFVALQALSGGSSVDPSGRVTASSTPGRSGESLWTPPATTSPIATSTAAAGSPTPASTAPSGTPKPSTAPKPTTTPGPTIPSGQTFTVTVPGSDYSSAEVAPNAKITPQSDGAIVIASTRGLSDPTIVLYHLPPSALPAGNQIASIDTLVCGSGSGDFWETYGPSGSTPDEHEAEAPADDGCWHYEDAPGPDTTVTAIIRTQTTLRIDRVVYTITVL